jgi:GAF domain-containing protein
VPILYREYAMAFDANLSPRELERYARAIWEQVRTNIGHRPPGKFVQVALFDHRFSGKPERAPAAVLAWKDWRGDPVIRIRTTKAAVSEVPPEGETAKAAPAAVRGDAPDSGWPLGPISSLPPASAEAPEIVAHSAPSEVVAAVQMAAAQEAAAQEAAAQEAAAQEAAAQEAAAQEAAAGPDAIAAARLESEAVIVEAELEPSGPLASPAPIPSPEPSPLLIEAEPLETSAPPLAAAAPAPVLELVPDFAVEKSDVAAAAALAAPPLAADESAAPPAAVAAPGSFPAVSPVSVIPVLPPPVPPPLEPKEAPGFVAPQADVAPEPAPVAPAPRATQPSQPKVGRAPAPRSSSNAIRRRGSSEDLIGELFEEMHQLHFMPDIVAGADYVLSCVLFMLPCEGVLIHVFDINSREFVVVRAAGPSFRDVLLTKTADTYPLFREAFRRAATLNFPKAEGDDRFTAERFHRLGVQVKSAMCGAVQHGGRYLGIIELMNPLGGEPFRVSEVNALDYICEQFADFVASRPIVLDEDAVLPKA